jgi:aspartate kinase
MYGQLVPHEDKLGEQRLMDLFGEAESVLSESPLERDYNELYDQVVCLGELASSLIVHQYLEFKEIRSTWVDVRTILRSAS